MHRLDSDTLSPDTAAHLLDLQVKEILSPHDDELEFGDLEQVKIIIYDNFKKYILSHAHPSVWYAIKTISSKTDPKWRQIFNIIPDALTW